jgi:hypothetical protein
LAFSAAKNVGVKKSRGEGVEKIKLGAAPFSTAKSIGGMFL